VGTAFADAIECYIIIVTGSLKITGAKLLLFFCRLSNINEPQEAIECILITETEKQGS